MKQKETVEKKELTAEVFEWMDVLVTAIVAVVILFTFVLRVATIKGKSMQNTLLDGQRTVISNWFYTPKQGDIVVVSRNVDNSVGEEAATPIIKRVIAVAGQTVDIDFQAGIVYVDGQALSEPYAKTPTNLSYDIEFPVRVPEGHIFCLGDNRNDSLDSRSSRIGDNGMIDTRYVLGRAKYRIYPLNRFGRIDKETAYE